MKLETPVKSSYGKPELVYALSSTIVLPRGRRGVFPGIELVGRKKFATEDHSLSVVPKIYISPARLGHVALSIGLDVPVVGRSEYKYRIVAFILWDYADGPFFKHW